MDSTSTTSTPGAATNCTSARTNRGSRSAKASAPNAASGSLPKRSKLYGRADLVEFHKPPGPRKRGSPVIEIPFPVEYKRGKKRRWDNDDVQLCAQGLCLEEMLGVAVPGGAVYHEAEQEPPRSSRSPPASAPRPRRPSLDCMRCSPMVACRRPSSSRSVEAARYAATACPKPLGARTASPHTSATSSARTASD